MPGTIPRSRRKRWTASVTLPRKSAAIVLPSMIRALMIRCLGRTALARRGDFLQRCDQRWAVARNHEKFEAGRSPGDQGHVTRWDAHGLGDQPDQGRVGLAFARRRPHPDLEDSASIRQDFATVNVIAATLRRQSHCKCDTADRRRPWLP